MEQLLDKFPNGPSVHPEYIWQSSVFCDLKDSSGIPFFLPPKGEGCLVFSLAVDSFDPFHNKQSKQKVSSTAIWLVVLNLPLHLRYFPENMFLAGILPGKPSLEEMNHSMQLVVNNVKKFWEPGVFFSRTQKYRCGRLFKGMVVPLIADMLGARQVIDMPGTAVAHYFCTFCNTNKDDIDVTDHDEWPAKFIDNIGFFTNLWKNASDEKQQQEIFDAFGWQWSPLLDLPYWDPVLYTVIDSMHALDKAFTLPLVFRSDSNQTARTPRTVLGLSSDYSWLRGLLNI
jgi:hypothetical protein